MSKLALKLMVTKCRKKHEICFFKSSFKNTAEGLMLKLHIVFVKTLVEFKYESSSPLINEVLKTSLLRRLQGRPFPMQ